GASDREPPLFTPRFTLARPRRRPRGPSGMPCWQSSRLHTTVPGGDPRGVAHTSRLTTAAGRYTARPARPVPTRVPRAARAGGGGMAAAAAGASAWDDTTWAAWGVGLVEPLLDP